MLRSKASPVTSPTSKAPGTSHQAQRSFLKEADEASPAPRAYLLPALCSPTSTPCLFLADLRQANTFHWDNTNAVKNLVPQKRANKATGETLGRTSPKQQISLGGQGDLQASLQPQAEVSPPREPGRELGVLSVRQRVQTINTQPSKPAGLDVTPPKLPRSTATCLYCAG